jgi:hypothetical protein
MKVLSKNKFVFKYNKLLQLKKILNYSTIPSVSLYDQQYEQSINNRCEFWQNKIDSIKWFQKPTKVFESNQSLFENKW